MANAAKKAILKAKLEGVLYEIMVKTNAEHVYVNDTTTLATYLTTLATNADLEQAINNLGALATKEKITQDDLDEALASLIAGKAEQTALQAEIERATAAEETLSDRIDLGEAVILDMRHELGTLTGQVTTLVGEDANKSVRTIANEELAAQLIGENAKESLDTLEEIAKWIQDHPDDASAMNAAIAALQAKVDTGDSTVSQYVAAAITALDIGDYAKAADLTELAGRVEAAEGDIAELKETVEDLGALAHKDQVAENDLADALKEKVNAASEGNHSHLNKALLDTYTQTEADLADAVAKKHAHTNATVLNGITADTIAAWNAKGNIYYSAEEPANLTENDLWIALVD